MIVVAHAGHWAVQLLYALPLLALGFFLGRDWLRGRRKDLPDRDGGD